MRCTRVLILSSTALVLGCQSPAEPPSGLRVSASVKPVPAVAGGPLSIEVVVANTSTGEHFVSGSAGGCIAVVDVHDAAGKAVMDTNPRICDAASVQHRVAPSSTLFDRLPFSGLRSGVYHLRARVGVPGYGELRSPEYTVTVLAP